MGKPAKLSNEEWARRRGDGGSWGQQRRRMSRWLWRSVAFKPEQDEKTGLMFKVDELLTQGTLNVGRNNKKFVEEK